MPGPGAVVLMAGLWALAALMPMARLRAAGSPLMRMAASAWFSPADAKITKFAVIAGAALAGKPADAKITKFAVIASVALAGKPADVENLSRQLAGMKFDNLFR